MPRCVICNTKFFAQTMAEPAEPCNCALNFTIDDARADPEYALIMLREWLRKVEATK